MSKFTFGTEPIVVNGTTHYPFSSNSANWRADALAKSTIDSKSVSYPQTQGYGRTDKSLKESCIQYQVSLHELRNAMPYLDIKYATPESWRALVDQVLGLYSQSGELLLEFIAKNAVVSALTGKVNLFTQVQDYLNSKKDFCDLNNMKSFYGNLDSLSYFVSLCQKSNFQEYVNKTKSIPISNDVKNNMLGQLREEVISISASTLSELVDKVIVLFRGKVLVHNMHLWTPTKIYTYKEARQILGTYSILGKNYDILEILDVCPYFSTTVNTKPHIELFMNQVLSGKVKLLGSRRDIPIGILHERYKTWCKSMDINSPLSEVQFCWQVPSSLCWDGLKFQTSGHNNIAWTS